MLTKKFWLDTTERAVKTAAQTVLALWLVADLALNAWTIDWTNTAGVALAAAAASVLSSVASAGSGELGTASLAKLNK